jgi:DNA-binding transcriptional LysR family regulator
MTMSPSLADLDAFVAVARARGFRGAAQARGASASGLSEAVRRLEAALGVRLLNRTTRSVTTTEAGERLLERLKPALGEIESGLDVVNSFRASPRGTLKLNVPVIVAAKILPPIASRFLKAYPGVTLEIAANDTFIDVIGAGFDAGIRYEERIERDMIAVPIGPRVQHYVAAAAPAYLAARGAPPRDLVNHACIRHRFASGAVADWEFERGGESVRIKPEGPLIASANELELDAAIAGLGIICTFEDFLREALDRGDLKPVLADWRQSFSGPFLYYPSRNMPAPLRAFVDFIRMDGGYVDAAAERG